MKTIEFLYRDGANWKWYFHIEVSDEKFAELEKVHGDIDEGTEMCYDEDFGITKEEFFNERQEATGYIYEEEFDHNILEVVGIKTHLDEPVSFTFK